MFRASTCTYWISANQHLSVFPAALPIMTNFITAKRGGINAAVTEVLRSCCDRWHDLSAQSRRGAKERRPGVVLLMRGLSLPPPAKDGKTDDDEPV
jgi:hypothetical protein